MQREAWTNTMASVVLGAFCVLLRWLQNVNSFDAETGLITSGAVLSWMLGILLFVSVLVLAGLSWNLNRFGASTDPEEALADPPKGLIAVLGAAAMAAAIGSIILFFTGIGAVNKFTGLLGLLAVPALMLYPFLPRWGVLGAFLSLNPMFFFCYWLVTGYRTYAVDPVLWSYAPLMLAIAAMCLATYRLSAYLFYRAKPAKTVFFCCLAPVFALTILMDTATGASRLILGAWAVGMLALAGLLILNMTPPSLEEDGEEDA